MKWIVYILLCSTCAGEWVTNSTIPNITTVDAIIAGNTQETYTYLVNTNGDKHLMISYYGGTVGNLVDVNMTQDSVRKTNYFSGRISYKTFAYTNGVFYFFEREVSGGGSGYGRLSSYIPATGTTNPISLTGGPVPYCSEWGLDGKLYIGHYRVSGANADRYTWETSVFENIGEIDTNSTASYCYFIGSDGDYVYAYVGPDDYRLTAKKISTGASTNFFEGITETYYPIYKGKAGGLFTVSRTNGVMAWYALSNGSPTFASTRTDFYTNVWYYENAQGVANLEENWRGNVLDQATSYTNAAGFMWDMSLSLPNSSNNWATFGYTVTNSGVWEYVSTTNFSLTAAVLTQIQPDGNNLFVVSFLYGPLLNYDTTSGTVTCYGTPPYEIHGAVKNVGSWYLSGYNAATLKFDPLSSWSLFAGVDETSESINPHKLSLSMLRIETSPCFGSDGLLYASAYHVRGTDGGEIGWWNPTTKATGSYRPTDWELAANVPFDMVPVLGGTKLVYLAGAQDWLYVFDVVSKTVTRTNSSILSGVTTLRKCVEVADGIVVGLSGNQVWRYNVSTDTVTYTNTLPGTAWSGFEDSALYASRYKLSTGPDGYIWATLENDLYRIHPSTCTPELVKVGVGPHNVIFDGGNCYLYNPTTPELHVLNDLLIMSGTTATITTATIGNLRIQ